MLSLALLLLLRVLRMRFSATDVFQSAVVVIPARAPREPSLPRGASPTRLPGLTLRTDLQPLFLFLLGKKKMPQDPLIPFPPQIWSEPFLGGAPACFREKRV